MFWEAQNIRKGRKLMSVDMLFLDEQEPSVDTYPHLFIEGFVYSLSGFDTPSNTFPASLLSSPTIFAPAKIILCLGCLEMAPYIQLSDAHVSIPFNDEEKKEKLAEIKSELDEADVLRQDVCSRVLMLVSL
ncbi:hypothetical protein YC2023_014342 [Brassica napus]